MAEGIPLEDPAIEGSAALPPAPGQPLATTPEDALAMMEPTVLMWAERMCRGDREAREDLAQEGRLAVVTSLPRWRPEVASLRTFLGHCVRGAVLHWVRDRYRLIAVPAWAQERKRPYPVAVSLDAVLESDDRHPMLAATGSVEDEALARVFCEQWIRRAHLSPHQSHCLVRKALGCVAHDKAEASNRTAVRTKLRRARSELV